MIYEKQQKRFLEIFEKNQKNLGTIVRKMEDNFLFFVEIPLSLVAQKSMLPGINEIKNQFPMLKKQWIETEKMAITIALPGRMGTHFQGNQVSFMEDRLKKMAEKMSPFEIELANINCFESSLFREVLDPSENLLMLHREVCEAIPFSQNPDYQYENFVPHVSTFFNEEELGEILKGSQLKRELLIEKMTVDCFNFGKISIEDHNFQKIILKTFEF